MLVKKAGVLVGDAQALTTAGQRIIQMATGHR